MTVQQLKREMSAQELLDWKVLEKIEPFGQLREDHRFALLASAITNALGTKKQDGSRFKPDDFLLAFEEAKDAADTAQGPERIEAMFRMAVAANNAFWEKRELMRATAAGRSKTPMRQIGVTH